MKNVMIVDDETLVRIGMQSIIDWEREGYRIVAVCADGREALEAMADAVPDIVLTDIRMPGMDGFELMAEALKRYPHIQFIILSSYEDFEYTRRAIRAGVKDYVLKHQMEPEELLRILNRMEVAERPTQGSDPLAAEKSEWLERFSRLAREGGTEGEAEEERFPLLRKALAAKGERLRWIYVRLLGEADESSGRRAALALVAETMRRWRQVEPVGVQDDACHGAYVWSAEDEGNVGAALERLYLELARNLEGKLNVRPVVGVSRPIDLQTTPALLPAARQAARAAELAFYGGGRLYAADRDPVMSPFGEAERYKLYKTAKERLLTGTEDFAAWFEEYAAEIAEAGGKDGERGGDGAGEGAGTLPKRLPEREEWLDFADMLHTLLIDRLMESAGPQGADDRILRQLREELARVKRSESFADYRKAMCSMIDAAGEALAEAFRERSWVKDVEEWLESRYGDPVRLEDAARHVSFSPGYFSQRFRQETGMSFTDYLTRLRIRKAMELLREGKLSTEQIAERVGYPNANYFVKVFKKVTGRTVSSFKGT